MTIEEIQKEILPLFEGLDDELVADGARDASVFFEQVRDSIASARSTDALMPAFQQLSTAAFQGFSYGPVAFAMVDRILECASGVAAVLASAGETRH